MSFRQLYYTSCTHGLSGFAGFQFNAVSDGVAPDLMRAVESLTAYQVPRSLTYAQTPDDLERCPVNLCYAPGETSVLAQVVYVGTDNTNRFGNYFAHALATRDPRRDLGRLLPIEFWRASWWQRAEVADTTLPELKGPAPRGVVERVGVAAFLDGHQHADRLAALLSAVADTIMHPRRRVLVIEGDTDRVASWFAAVSYLLPPPLVRRMSFATYHHRPSHARSHLLGTVPEMSAGLGADALTSFHLFDFAAGRFSVVDVHPLAELLASVGVVKAADLWERAGVFVGDSADPTSEPWSGQVPETGSGADAEAGTGRGDREPDEAAPASARGAGPMPRELDDWYAAASAASAVGGTPLDERDVERVLAWLRDLTASGAAARIRRPTPPGLADVVEAIGPMAVPALGQPRSAALPTPLAESDADRVLLLRQAAELAEAGWLSDEFERRLADSAVAAVLARRPRGPAADRPLRPVGRAQAAARLRRLLVDEDPVPARLLPLLVWAYQGGVDLPDEAAAVGFARALLPSIVSGAVPVADLFSAVDAWPGLRRGLAEASARLLASDEVAAERAMDNGLLTLLRDDELNAYPGLRRIHLLSRARANPSWRPEAVALTLREEGLTAVTAELLRKLWPEGMNLSEVRQLADKLPDGRLYASGDVVEILERPLTGALADLPVALWMPLAEWLVAEPLGSLLSADVRPRLRGAVEVYRAIEAATTTGELVESFAPSLVGLERLVVEERLPPRMLSLRADVLSLRELVLRAPRDVRDRYLQDVEPLLAKPRVDLRVHVAGLFLLLTDRAEQGLKDNVRRILHDLVNRWPRAEVDAIAALIDRAGPTYGDDFRRWCARHVRPPRRVRAARRARRAVKLLFRVIRLTLRPIGLGLAGLVWIVRNLLGRGPQPPDAESPPRSPPSGSRPGRAAERAPGQSGGAAGRARAGRAGEGRARAKR